MIPENIKILLYAGANYTLKSTLRKTTPLDLAIEYNNNEAVIMFLEMVPQALCQDPLSENRPAETTTPPLEAQEDVLIRPQKKRFNKPRKSVIKNVVPAYRLPQITTFRKAKRLKMIEPAN